MKVEKQKQRLPIRSYTFSGGCLRKKHGELFPDNIRAIIAGPSNCGKTNLMLSLLIDKNGPKFENVYLFSKSTDQPKYDFLEKVLKEAGIGFYPMGNNILKPEEVLRNSVCIFDDVITEKQGPIQDFFAMGRHREIDSFYLGQTYSRIPKILLRDNANFVCLFRMDDMNLHHVWSDHVAADMSFKQFQEMCVFCWKTPHGFIVIDKESGRNNGGYRKGFDYYIKSG